MNRPICIIDDDEDIRTVMTYALELDGIQSMCFSSARSALEFLPTVAAKNLPCLIIVDYMMPEMNGGEFIKKIKEEHSRDLGRIPVVLSTARLLDETGHIPSSILRLEKPVDLGSFLKLAREFYFKEDFAPQLNY